MFIYLLELIEDYCLEILRINILQIISYLYVVNSYQANVKFVFHHFENDKIMYQFNTWGINGLSFFPYMYNHVNHFLILIPIKKKESDRFISTNFDLISNPNDADFALRPFVVDKVPVEPGNQYWWPKS